MRMAQPTSLQAANMDQFCYAAPVYHTCIGFF